jgi:hypothetical protein
MRFVTELCTMQTRRKVTEIPSPNSRHVVKYALGGREIEYELAIQLKTLDLILWDYSFTFCGVWDLVKAVIEDSTISECGFEGNGALILKSKVISVICQGTLPERTIQHSSVAQSVAGQTIRKLYANLLSDTRYSVKIWIPSNKMVVFSDVRSLDRSKEKLFQEIEDDGGQWLFIRKEVYDSYDSLHMGSLPQLPDLTITK